MKVSNINFLYCLLFIMMSAFCVSCSKDQSYDFPGDAYNRVYFDKSNSVVEGTITNTPVGSFSDVELSLPVRCIKKESKAIKVDIALNSDLVDVYNSENETSYKKSPEGSVVIENGTLTIPADSTISSDSVRISINEKYLSEYSDTTGYLIPIVISSVEGGSAAPSTNMDVKYLHIGITSTMIKKNVGSTGIEGNLVLDYSGWTASCSSSSSNDFKLLVDKNTSTGWNFNVNQVSIVVDMGSIKNVTGFRSLCKYGIYGTNYRFSSIGFAYSSDGTNFINGGTSSDSGIVNENGYQYIALWGTIMARYLKINYICNSIYAMGLYELGIYTQ